jgi:hypothetical protein
MTEESLSFLLFVFLKLAPTNRFFRETEHGAPILKKHLEQVS